MDNRPHHHNGPPPPPPGYPPFQPQQQTAQPPTISPFSDPFQNPRDPFLFPSGGGNGHGRRDSYGGPARGWPSLQAPNNAMNPLHQPHQLPPPPPQHSLGPGPPPGQMYPFESRRPSLSGASVNGMDSPSRHAGHHDHPPPPPFPSQQMPPPSSAAHLASAPRGPPSASPFAGIRDLPGFRSGGNGMAITSLLDRAGGHERSSPRMMPGSLLGERGGVGSSPHMAGMSGGAMRPPSPGSGRMRASSMREPPSAGRGNREQSPLGGLGQVKGGIFEPRAQSAVHTERVFDAPMRAGSAFSQDGGGSRREMFPDRDRGNLGIENGLGGRRDVFAASPLFQRESPHSFRAFRPGLEGQVGGGGEGMMRQGSNGPVLLGRPSSQPAEMLGRQVVMEEMGARREAPTSRHTMDEMVVRRETPPGSVQGQFGGFRQFAEPGALQRQQERPPYQLNGVTSQPREREVYESPQMDRDVRYTPGRFQPPGPFGPGGMREDTGGQFRPMYPPTADLAARESIEPQLSGMQELRREEPRSSPIMGELPLYLRGRNSNNFTHDRPITFEEHQRLDAMAQQQQRDSESQRKESDSARSLLAGISPELSRKAQQGRDSPLPQAVHGAQPRPGNINANAGIKREFGMMFSGLGSGVGSATPVGGLREGESMGSPLRQYDEDGDVELVAVGVAKSRAKRAKAGRRSLEEDGDSGMTPDEQRSGKRAKASHPPGHHHHHHLHSHHHHHHHADGEGQQQQQQNGGGSFNMLRFPPANNAAAVAAGVGVHHHHHAGHAHPHHHHHNNTGKDNNVAPAPLPRKITTTINSSAVMDSVASKPRKHLGSMVYSTSLSEASNKSLTMDAKVKFKSTVKPIPLFEGKENCTFTVRVPRFYLASSEEREKEGEGSALEEVCKRRQLWGSEVYSDDSDVVAAAVHSGWIRGDFGKMNADIDKLCGDESEEVEVNGDVPSTMLKRPTRPVKVPQERDMHVTLLILPPLQGYRGTMAHHLRSRDWEGTHDGMSFSVLRIDFVDEGMGGRYVERGITARKERMRIEEARRREAVEGLLMFAMGGRAIIGGGGAVSVGA
ncbi:hypothetical protein LTR15_012852 [Elasticomyces elasticus]|nr:hypothetical protein LTR15_012852 [Elasticomyces elasticus]